jgi:hypothetical protein
MVSFPKKRREQKGNGLGKKSQAGVDHGQWLEGLTGPWKVARLGVVLATVANGRLKESLANI